MKQNTLLKKIIKGTQHSILLCKVLPPTLNRSRCLICKSTWKECHQILHEVEQFTVRFVLSENSHSQSLALKVSKIIKQATIKCFGFICFVKEKLLATEIAET